jgi:N-acylneuraminate cytidylyltransferase
MISGLKILAIVPARGGSKGIARKNLCKVGGKPLIAWAIEAGHASRYIDRLILSSEDAEIIRVAEQWGCEVPFVRPAELAQDDTPGVEPVLHAIEQVPGYELIVLLQPTSPLRTTTDIDGCIELCIAEGAKSCVSLCEVEQHPAWMYKLDEQARMNPLLSGEPDYARRQDLPPVYILNGAVYVAEREWLRRHRTFVAANTLGYVMPRERSLDIDQELDIKVCDEVLRKAAQG